jgi:hypothetical protein
MNKFLIALFISVIAFEVMAIDAYSIREIRDPVKMKARLDADFASLASGSGVNAVTNVTVAAQTKSITYVGIDGGTNTLAVCTNVVVTLQRN